MQPTHAEEGTRTVHRSRGALLGCGLASVLAAGTLFGCTGPQSPQAAAAGSSDASSTVSSAVPLAPSVPLRVRVTHVAGVLSDNQRAAVAHGIGRALGTYLDGGFLGGRYPRTDFTSALAAFTPGVRGEARADAALLTNRALGASTSAVRASRRTAYVSVLAPRAHAAGASAAVDLVFDVERGHQHAQRVHLTGRLLLTHLASGRWSIFGYHLDRSVSAAGGTS